MFCPSLTSHLLLLRCRLSVGAACSGKRQSELSGSRHRRAAQRSHPGSLQLDPVLSGPGAKYFRWWPLTVFKPEEDPEPRNPEAVLSHLHSKLHRSPVLPTGLRAPAFRVPGFCSPYVLPHYQEPVCVAPAGSKQPSERPATCTHSGKREAEWWKSLSVDPLNYYSTIPGFNLLSTKCQTKEPNTSSQRVGGDQNRARERITINSDTNTTLNECSCVVLSCCLSSHSSVSSQASALDALLDDSVMFAKKLKDMGQPVSLTVVEDLPHGFLSLSQLAKETEVASEICVEQMRKIFQQQSPTPALRKRPKMEETFQSTNPSG